MCRSSLYDVAYEWVARPGEVGPGDIVRISHSSHPAFDHCGEVVSYNIGNHKAQVKLREEVEGRRI